MKNKTLEQVQKSIEFNHKLFKLGTSIAMVGTVLTLLGI